VADVRPVRFAFAASLMTHVTVLAFALVAWRSARPSRPVTPPEQNRIVHLVWSNEPGSGGGGGGGNRRREPVQQLKLTGKDRLSVSARKRRTIDTTKPLQNDRDAIRRLIVPVVTLASATEWLPGATGAHPLPDTGSLGPGSDDGAGTGTGTGDGPGHGPGVGPGREGGTGGEGYRPGSGVSMPVAIRKGIPRYTADAMRARAQGSIIVECVVQPNGACSNIQVKRSFRPAFGLDEEAIKAAEQWRFRPGSRAGQPVPMLVTIEIAFALR
jgi:protein TonB